MRKGISAVVAKGPMLHTSPTGTKLELCSSLDKQSKVWHDVQSWTRKNAGQEKEVNFIWLRFDLAPDLATVSVW